MTELGGKCHFLYPFFFYPHTRISSFHNSLQCICYLSALHCSFSSSHHSYKEFPKYLNSISFSIPSSRNQILLVHALCIGCTYVCKIKSSLSHPNYSYQLLVLQILCYILIDSVPLLQYNNHQDPCLAKHVQFKRPNEMGKTINLTPLRIRLCYSFKHLEELVWIWRYNAL